MARSLPILGIHALRDIESHHSDCTCHELVERYMKQRPQRFRFGPCRPLPSVQIVQNLGDLFLFRVILRHRNQKLLNRTTTHAASTMR